MRILIPLVAIALSGSAVAADSATRDHVSDEQKLATALNGLVPDKPIDCIDQHQSGQIEAIGGTILYKVSRRLIYRNDTGGGCEAIAHGDILLTVTSYSRLCRGDIGRTIDHVTQSTTGSCGLGNFVPYRRPG